MRWTIVYALLRKMIKAVEDVLPRKADLVDGFVPASQLAGQYLETEAVDTYSELPAQGNPNKIYIVRDENDQQYRWAGSGVGYIKTGEKDAYYVAETVGLTTMGELRAFIDSINSQGLHVILDFHTFVTDAYVCTAHVWTGSGVNHCEIFDLLNHQLIFDASGYADTDTIASYVAANKHKIVTDADTETWTFTLADQTTVTKKVVALP